MIVSLYFNFLVNWKKQECNTRRQISYIFNSNCYTIKTNPLQLKVTEGPLILFPIYWFITGTRRTIDGLMKPSIVDSYQFLEKALRIGSWLGPSRSRFGTQSEAISRVFHTDFNSKGAQSLKFLGRLFCHNFATTQVFSRPVFFKSETPHFKCEKY